MKITGRHDSLNPPSGLSTLEALASAVKSLFEAHNNAVAKNNQVFEDIERQSSGIKASPSGGSASLPTGSGGGGGGTVGILPVAGFFSIASIADTTVTFLRPIPIDYVLAVWYVDTAGQFANVPILKADQSGTQFIVRAGNEPGLGTYFFSAIPIQ